MKLYTLVMICLCFFAMVATYFSPAQFVDKMCIYVFFGICTVFFLIANFTDKQTPNI